MPAYPFEAIDEQPSCVIAFIQGAKWWEYKRTGATMWMSDQDWAEREAVERMAAGSLGIHPYTFYLRKKEEITVGEA